MADVPEITQDDLDNTPETPAVTSPAFAPDSSFGDGSAQTPSEQPVPDAPESSSTSEPSTDVLPDPSAAPQTAPDSESPTFSSTVSSDPTPTTDPTVTPSVAASDSETPIFEGQVSGQGVDPSPSPDSSAPTSSEPSTNPEPVSSTPSSDTDSPAPASSDPHEGDDVDTDLPAFDTPDDDPDPAVVTPSEVGDGQEAGGYTDPEPTAPTFPAPAEQGQDGVDEETGQVIPNTSIEQGPGLPPEVSASPSPTAPGGLSVATDEDDDTSASVWVPGEDNDDYDDGENHGATLANGAVFEQSVSGYTPHFRGSIVNSTIQVQRADWVGTEVFTVDASDVDELVDFIQKLAGFIED